MTTLALHHVFETAQSWARERLTRKGPRAYADTHDVALSLLGGAPPCRVVDLGAGGGQLSRRLDLLGHEVVAVERYAEQFEAHVPLVDADLNFGWPFDDASFDAAMAVEILEHLENPRFFLRELARVLRPRGVAIVSTPNITTLLSKLLFLTVGQWDLFFDHPWRLRDPYSSAVQGHITPLPGWLLDHHARDAGFDIEDARFSRAWLPCVPWKINPLPSNARFGRILLVRLRKR
jgi:SAM-dependent methyltransferase